MGEGASENEEKILFIAETRQYACLNAFKTDESCKFFAAFSFY